MKVLVFVFASLIAFTLAAEHPSQNRRGGLLGHPQKFRSAKIVKKLRFEFETKCKENPEDPKCGKLRNEEGHFDKKKARKMARNILGQKQHQAHKNHPDPVVDFKLEEKLVQRISSCFEKDGEQFPMGTKMAKFCKKLLKMAVLDNKGDIDVKKTKKKAFGKMMHLANRQAERRVQLSKKRNI